MRGEWVEFLKYQCDSMCDEASDSNGDAATKKTQLRVFSRLPRYLKLNLQNFLDCSNSVPDIC